MIATAKGEKHREIDVYRSDAHRTKNLPLGEGGTAIAVTDEGKTQWNQAKC